MNKGVIALAWGAFGFSCSEYMMVGVLSAVASGLHVTTAQAGHFLSAYALGVVMGAVLLATGFRGASPKKTLLIIAAWFVLGSLLTAAADGYGGMLAARFAAGLPQGGYFAVASLTAEHLAAKGKSAGAVAAMFSGMTIATLAGVPLGTFLTHAYSWRLVYALIGLCGFVSLYFIWKWLPALSATPKTDLRKAASFLKNGWFWILLLGVVLGNGGIFCWLSYINPLLENSSGIPVKLMPLVMAVTGLGMLAGNWISGKYAERFAAARVAAWVQGLACACLLFIFMFPTPAWLAVSLAFLGSGLMFALTVPEQMLMISAAPQGALMGSCIAQAGFYLGNTVGALGGSVPISVGWGYRYTSLAGLLLALAGFGFLILYARKMTEKTAFEQTLSTRPAARGEIRKNF